MMASAARTEAATLAAAGNTALAAALMALENAIAALVASTGKHGAATRV